MASSPLNAPSPQHKIYTRKIDNPYHQRLSQFDSFVLRDLECEQRAGQWTSHLGRSPLAVELGVGYGDFLMTHLKLWPQYSYVGLDMRFKRSFGVASRLNDYLQELKQAHPASPSPVALLRAQAERLEHIFAPGEINRLYCFCPDPWPKKKHHKNRLLKTQYLETIATCCAPKALFYFKTDNTPYFEWLMEQLDQQQAWSMRFQSWDLYGELHHHAINEDFIAPLLRHRTKFEQLFIAQGQKIKAVILENK